MAGHDDLVSWAPKGDGETFQEVLTRRVSRRDVLRAGVVASAIVAIGSGLRVESDGSVAVPTAAAAPHAQTGGLTFTPIKPDTTDQVTVSPGYKWSMLFSWGDPLFPGVPKMDLFAQTAELQAKQVGFNADFVGWMPLPLGSKASWEGLVFNNHEYTDGVMMFPKYDPKAPTKEQVEIELQAHGASVVHSRRDANGEWSYDVTSRYNRRITATTPMKLSGPAAGADWLKSSADPTGTQVAGMLNNCGGGWTPWGTILTAEENFNQYFANADGLPDTDPRKKAHARYGLPKAASERLWESFYDRFDIAKEPNEPFRHGWVVEIDPYDPASTPAKRTALGRMKHEAATCVVAPNGKVVAYMGDDERFDYVYKFVSDGTYNPNDRAANMNLLDAGTLYVAKFNDDGTGAWIPLVHGQGKLTAENGFNSQADILINSRQAGDAVGATKMDRPEDVETNPVTSKVYMVFTNNNQRGAEGRAAPDKANPRATNNWGHIIEATEEGNDFSATTFKWEMFIVGREPSDPSTYFAGYPKDQVSPIGCPDNICFDSKGNIWIATDGQPTALKVNDAIHAVPVAGPQRGRVMQILSAVPGAEVASLAFNPDDTALFVSIQHPGEGGTLEKPTSTWPDGQTRPALVVITRHDGKAIGA